MQSVLIVIHILIVIALVAVVLLQRSEGGVLGSGGSTSNFLTGRGQANALSRATAILAGLFFATSLLMSILAGWSRAPRSILTNTPASSQNTPAPVGQGNILDQLKQLQNQSDSSPAPAAPASPEPAPEPKQR